MPGRGITVEVDRPVRFEHPPQLHQPHCHHDEVCRELVAAQRPHQRFDEVAYPPPVVMSAAGPATSSASASSDAGPQCHVSSNA